MTTGGTGGGDTSASRHLYSIEYDNNGGALTPLQGQPIIDLFRSLSIGGIVAFVGSGNSTLLGYDSWDGLSERLLRLAYKVSRRQPIDVRLREAIVKAKAMLDSGDASDEIDKFDRLAMATEMLRQLPVERGDYRRSDLLRQIFAFPDTLSTEYARKVCNALSRRHPFRPHASDLREEIKRLGNRGYVPIDFVAGLQLASVLAGLKDSPSPPPRSLPKTRLLDTPSPSIDVLGTLRKDWKVSRYATLNYDHEIERMLERTDFPFESLTPRFSQSESTEQQLRKDADRGPKLSVRSRLGEKARSVDLDRSNVAEFMLFAADSPAGVSQVLHLHGSVRDPAQMIVTDIDYNRRYFVNAPWNQVLEDSQELLYRANAIVFIGVGMSEDVLFRAMRILSQAPEREARPVYAFMSSKGEIKDTADGIKLFQRYGIRTIFYGTRLDRTDDPEAGNFRDHPLVRAALEDRGVDPGNKAQVEESLARIANNLNPLSIELNYLKKIEKCLHTVERNKESDSVARASSIEASLRNLDSDLEKILGSGVVSDPLLDGFNKDSLPRLSFTPWHRVVFRLVCTALHARDKKGDLWVMDKAVVKALGKAVSALSSAIHARALQDALQEISAKSISWRKRWQDRPARPDSDPKDRPWHFRSADGASFGTCEARVCSHNISRAHDESEPNRRLLKQILRDESGKGLLEVALDKIEKHRSVVARARNGAGKGMLASRFSEPDCCPARGRRLVVSFGQSCGRDPVFDLMAYYHPKHPSQAGQSSSLPLEYIVSRLDIAMTLVERRPKLAEWDAFFRNTIDNENTRWLMLCETIETVEYLTSLRSVGHQSPSKSMGFKEWDFEEEGAFRHDVDIGGDCIQPGEAGRLADILGIAKTCRSVWVASFLTSVYVMLTTQYVPRGQDKGEIFPSKPSGSDYDRIGANRFDEIISRIDHALNITQDPRQRVPSLIDVTIAQIETHVLRQRDTDARITKVISHAILKHLFAFGGPVEPGIFARCPEFHHIADDYRDRIRDEAALSYEIDEALKWLRSLDMITESTDCYSSIGQMRYGLHAHVRNWLATKKGLPFSVVVGREQTAITVIPVIDEEIVPLDRKDYAFIWDTVDNLLKPSSADAGASQDQVRAAFMLLRGSMRIGSVLRWAHGRESEASAGHTSLEEYLRRLLDLRHAALRCAEFYPTSTAPLFEREWVWLFNEMGVVKLLQGHAHDASALFEQAIEFESRRLRDKQGFEALIYDAKKFPEFSITKLRVMMNLAMAEIERGAFNRAERILSSEKRDIEALRIVFSVEDEEIPKSRRIHREIRILLLVLGLVDARLKFLCGSAGESARWLEDNGREIVAEGVHGLNALYFLIRADVESGRRNHSAAAEMFATARVEAEASGRSDLIFSVMLGEAALRMAMQRRPGADELQQQLSRIRKIKHEAERMGMSRVVVNACMLRARLYLGFGEYRSARQDLMTALTKATSCGLCVKRASALIDMAALVGSLDVSLRGEARDIARSARFDAERMGYKLGAARAKDLELVLREQGSIEDWLFRAGTGKNGLHDEGD